MVYSCSGCLIELAQCDAGHQHGFRRVERTRSEKLELTTPAAKLPKPAAPADEGEATKKIESEVSLPQTLVRIPVESEEQARKPQTDTEKDV